MSRDVFCKACNKPINSCHCVPNTKLRAFIKYVWTCPHCDKTNERHHGQVGDCITCDSCGHMSNVSFVLNL